MKNQHWIIGIPSATELNFQHVCMLDLYIPYIQALLFFLPAWHISLYFCSDVPYLQFPLRVSVSHVKSLVVSGSDGVSQFLLQSVSAPPKTINTNSFTVFSFQGFLFPLFYCKTSLNTIQDRSDWIKNNTEHLSGKIAFHTRFYLPEKIQVLSQWNWLISPCPTNRSPLVLQILKKHISLNENPDIMPLCPPPMHECPFAHKYKRVH